MASRIEPPSSEASPAEVQAALLVYRDACDEMRLRSVLKGPTALRDLAGDQRASSALSASIAALNRLVGSSRAGQLREALHKGKLPEVPARDSVARHEVRALTEDREVLPDGAKGAEPDTSVEPGSLIPVVRGPDARASRVPGVVHRDLEPENVNAPAAPVNALPETVNVVEWPAPEPETQEDPMPSTPKFQTETETEALAESGRRKCELASCGLEFAPDRPNQKFCQKDCMLAAARGRYDAKRGRDVSQRVAPSRPKADRRGKFTCSRCSFSTTWAPALAKHAKSCASSRPKLEPVKPAAPELEIVDAELPGEDLDDDAGTPPPSPSRRSRRPRRRDRDAPVVHVAAPALPGRDAPAPPLRDLGARLRRGR